jgi:hypothetical protein
VTFVRLARVIPPCNPQSSHYFPTIFVLRPSTFFAADS